MHQPLEFFSSWKYFFVQCPMAVGIMELPKGLFEVARGILQRNICESRVCSCGRPSPLPPPACWFTLLLTLLPLVYSLALASSLLCVWPLLPPYYCLSILQCVLFFLLLSCKGTPMLLTSPLERLFLVQVLIQAIELWAEMCSCN